MDEQQQLDQLDQSLSDMTNLLLTGEGADDLDLGGEFGAPEHQAAAAPRGASVADAAPEPSGKPEAEIDPDPSAHLDAVQAGLDAALRQMGDAESPREAVAGAEPEAEIERADAGLDSEPEPIAAEQAAADGETEAPPEEDDNPTAAAAELAAQTDEGDAESPEAAEASEGPADAVDATFARVAADLEAPSALAEDGGPADAPLAADETAVGQALVAMNEQPDDETRPAMAAVSEDLDSTSPQASASKPEGPQVSAAGASPTPAAPEGQDAVPPDIEAAAESPAATAPTPPREQPPGSPPAPSDRPGTESQPPGARPIPAPSKRGKAAILARTAGDQLALLLARGIEPIGASLAAQQKVVRHSLAWMALWTAFNAFCIWSYITLFRSATPNSRGAVATQIATGHSESGTDSTDQNPNELPRQPEPTGR